MKGYKCMVCGKVVADTFGNILTSDDVSCDETHDGFPMYVHEKCMDGYVPQINYMFEQLNFIVPWVVN